MRIQFIKTSGKIKLDFLKHIFVSLELSLNSRAKCFLFWNSFSPLCYPFLNRWIQSLGITRHFLLVSYLSVKRVRIILAIVWHVGDFNSSSRNTLEQKILAWFKSRMRLSRLSHDPEAKSGHFDPIPSSKIEYQSLIHILIVCLWSHCRRHSQNHGIFIQYDPDFLTAQKTRFPVRQIFLSHFIVDRRRYSMRIPRCPRRHIEKRSLESRSRFDRIAIGMNLIDWNIFTKYHSGQFVDAYFWKTIGKKRYSRIVSFKLRMGRSGRPSQEVDSVHQFTLSLKSIWNGSDHFTFVLPPSLRWRIKLLWRSWVQRSLISQTAVRSNYGISGRCSDSAAAPCTFRFPTFAESLDIAICPNETFYSNS
jgi:hypothetical protein